MEQTGNACVNAVARAVAFAAVAVPLGVTGFDDSSELDRHGGSGGLINARLLEMAADARVSRIDNGLARLVRANTLCDRRDYAAAYRLYLSVMDQAGFLSVDGAAGAIRCLQAQEKTQEARELSERMAVRFPQLAAALRSLANAPKGQQP